jgi:RHS repeat-associated protein
MTNRLKRVIDPRGNSTWFIYNPLGQVTQVTRTGGTTTKSEYKRDGTLLWTQDELLHTTTYTCDEYKRPTEVKKVVGGVEEIVTNDYAPWNGLGRLSHTTASVYRVESPLHTEVHHDYDANFRCIWTKSAPGAPPTNFHYDPVGNLDRTEDPRHKFTTFGYDQRNRQTSTLNEELNQIVRVQYDAAGNKIRETRYEENDLEVFRSWDYDDMNRLWHAYDWRTNPTPTSNQTTTYQRDDAGNVLFTTDTKGAVYGFEYDKLNRKTKAQYPTAYPSPSPIETWHYDAAGNVDIYTNPANQVKNLHYDNHNRQYHSSWNGGAATGPDIYTFYDSASRVTSIVTKDGETPITTVAFGYDEANRKIWEDQTLVQPDGSVISHRVKSVLDHDGRRTNLQITDPPQLGGNLSVSAEMSGSGSLSITYDYTPRNQLWHITGDYGEDWQFTYSYDDSGNMTSRQADYNGRTSSTSCPNDDYDALNRPRRWEQTGPNGFHTLRHHQYDRANREKATWRDEDGIGERFTYEITNQLATAAYGGHVANGPPNDASRTVTYAYSPDKLNRSSMTEVGGPSPGVTNYSPNALNQYMSTAGHTFSYDGNFNLTLTQGFSGLYDAANRLVSASNGGSLENVPTVAGFVYDGLGRCVKRTLNGVETLFVYDDWKPIGEFDQWGNFQAWNVYGAGTDEILLRSKDKYGYTIFLLDRHGNVAFLVDNDGVLLEEYTYDVFGRPTISSVETGQILSSTWYSHDFLFQGREYISQLGIYDYRNRFYLPATGRFLQSDPKGFDAGDMNLFRYCGDDPVDLSDPLGLEGEVRSELEAAVSVARRQVEAAVVDPNRQSAVAYVQQKGTATFFKLVYYPSKMVPILKHDNGYEVGRTIDGKVTVVGGIPYELETPSKDYAGRVVLSVHSHNDKRGKGVKTNGVAMPKWSSYDNNIPDVDRMDESNFGKWYSRRNGKDVRSVRKSPGDASSSRSSNAPTGSSADLSPGPSAREVDLFHQSTGVPSLGQEAVNFAPGRP